jgi:hypothetical protein
LKYGAKFVLKGGEVLIYILARLENNNKNALINTKIAIIKKKKKKKSAKKTVETKITSPSFKKTYVKFKT